MSNNLFPSEIVSTRPGWRGFILTEAANLGELVFVGLGLFDSSDISLRGLEEARKSDFVFAEFYTSLMPGLSISELEKNVGKEVIVVSRKDLEEENGEPILLKACGSRVVFLVPGDPLISTTHIDLRLRAKSKGIRTKIVHGASIISAAIGLSGLQNYKFGRSVTLPFPENQIISETPYNVVAENKTRNLHTLCFLDIREEEKEYLTIKEALEMFLTLERKRKRSIVTSDSLAIGIARAGAEDAKIKADRAEDLRDYDFGSPPHMLIFPGNVLHFMEAEALIGLADAPVMVKEMVR